jgi:hypothetical protein
LAKVGYGLVIRGGEVVDHGSSRRTWLKRRLTRWRRPSTSETHEGEEEEEEEAQL